MEINTTPKLSEINTTPKVSLILHWGSEEHISALMDILYGGNASIEKRITALFRRGHWSVFELMGAQFLVECSRACHTQFIRHRMASYWAESQRYTDYTKREIKFIVPLGFPKELLEEAYDKYLKLRESYRPEYARMILPNAVAVRFVAQMNARELMFNFVPLRCAMSAQAEIRHVCWQMFALAWRLWPVLARLVWQELPSLHRDFCTKVPAGEDCRLYAIKDCEEMHGLLPERPWYESVD